MSDQSLTTGVHRSLSSIGDTPLVVATLVGAIGLLVGLSLPWLQPDPARETIRLVYIPGMDAGFEVDATLVLLLLVAASVAAGLLRGRSRLTGAALVLTGVATIALPTYLLVDIYLAYGGEFIPDIGSFVTIASGLILLVTGLIVLGTGRSDR
ncbi:hypothetical protein [Halovivax gelatinilyticus]|uniref:hypothetical protein n=1 Tax=Halovivax gelatinilyticus TaxID=2961597 RepID=UPI0020CA2F53|nr:hypothetical protein [Halovivax gelatinilyticus]